MSTPEIPIRFQFADGSIVEAANDCSCLPHIHAGPYWLHTSDLWRLRVDALVAKGNFHGAAVEGYLQARDLRTMMEHLGIVKIMRGSIT